jgi:hypothetical protein
MRLSKFRLPLLAATAWMGLGFSVWAMDLGLGETVFVTPTSTTYSLAPSYWLSTSYVTPTAYVVPSYLSTSYVVPSYYATSYAASSYYATTYADLPLAYWPTTYVATAYRRGLFGRRWIVERPLIASYGTTYLPTSYVSAYAPASYVYPSYYTRSYRVRSYAPTVYEYPTVWESAAVVRRSDCDEVAWAPAASSPAPPIVSRPGSSAGTRAGQQVDPSEDLTIPSDVGPARADERGGARASGSDAATKGQGAAGGRADSPPTPPAAEQSGQAAPKNPASQPATKSSAPSGTNAAQKQDTDAAAKTKAAPPAAPAGEPNEIDLKPAPGFDGSGTIRRDSSKPIYSTRALRPERRNVLIGKVESSTGEPQGEVPVTVTSRSNSLIHHDGLTNAFGGFAIRLTDGEWTVNVTMPSGRVYPVRTVTVTNGRVVDNQEGRDVHSLIITY